MLVGVGGMCSLIARIERITQKLLMRASEQLYLLEFLKDGVNWLLIRRPSMVTRNKSQFLFEIGRPLVESSQLQSTFLRGCLADCSGALSLYGRIGGGVLVPSTAGPPPEWLATVPTTLSCTNRSRIRKSHAVVQ
jgi:hypothetical protein